MVAISEVDKILDQPEYFFSDALKARLALVEAPFDSGVLLNAVYQILDSESELELTPKETVYIVLAAARIQLMLTRDFVQAAIEGSPGNENSPQIQEIDAQLTKLEIAIENLVSTAALIKLIEADVLATQYNVTLLLEMCDSLVKLLEKVSGLRGKAPGSGETSI
jgi:hypothetical protein